MNGMRFKYVIKGRYVGKQAARKYVPGSAMVYTIRFTSSHVASRRLLALKNSTMRTMVTIIPLAWVLVEASLKNIVFGGSIHLEVETRLTEKQ